MAIAHRACGTHGENVHRVVFDRSPFALGYLLQAGLDTCRLNASKIVSLAAGQNCDRYLVRLGGGKDKFHMLRRFFKRLQERIESLFGEHVDFVDDVDFEASSAGTHGDVLPQLADFVDTAIASSVDF